MEFISQPFTGLFKGVLHFYQPTKPTARPDGSALVASDRWYKTDDGTEWFWNGTYWLGHPLFLSHPQLTNLSSSSSGFYECAHTKKSIFVEEVVCHSIISTTNGASNYWTFEIQLGAVNSVGTQMALFSTVGDTPNSRVGKSVTPNLVYASNFPSDPSGAVLRLLWTRVGSAGLGFFASSLRYREIAP